MRLLDNSNKAVRLIKLLENEGVKHEHIAYLLNCHFEDTTFYSIKRDGRSFYYTVHEMPGIPNKLIYEGLANV